LYGKANVADAELASWAIFLLHEFAIHRISLTESDVAVDKICAIKGLIRILAGFIEPTETIVPRIALRLLNSLCDSKSYFF
jgi:hypothetical protein